MAYFLAQYAISRGTQAEREHRRTIRLHPRRRALLNFGLPLTLCSYICHSARSIRPKKGGPETSKQYQLKKLSEATLGSGNLRAAVTLPEGEDVNEWIAVNSV